MSYWIVYEAVTGRVTLCTNNLGRPLDAGEALLEVPELLRPSDVRVDLATLQVVPAAPPEMPLEVAQAKAVREIDTVAEVARLRFITQGAGQALEYNQTELEAKRWVDATQPELADYPFLQAEVDAIAAATGQTPDPGVVAANVIQQTAAWQAAGAAIKRIRRTAKMRIEAATTTSEVEAVLADLTWPEPA